MSIPRDDSRNNTERPTALAVYDAITAAAPDAKIVPVSRTTKVPVAKGWLDAPLTRDAIEMVTPPTVPAGEVDLGNSPPPWAGVVPASVGITVVDVDVHDIRADDDDEQAIRDKEAAADERAEAAIAAVGIDPITRVKTAGRGWHLLYKADGLEARSDFEHGEIVRGRGHAHVYDADAWVYAIGEAADARTPDFGALCTALPRTARTNAAGGDRPAGASGSDCRTPEELAAMPPDSGRNNALNRGVYQDARDGRLDDEREDAWRNAALASGLPARAVDNTIRSALKAARTNPRITGALPPRASGPAARTHTPPADADGDDPIPRWQIGPLVVSPEILAVRLASEHIKKRIRFDRNAKSWWRFDDNRGWLPLDENELVETIADCAQNNIGAWSEKKQSWYQQPAKWGRRSVGAEIAGLLVGRPEIYSDSDDWDADGELIGLPNGEIYNVATNQTRPPDTETLIRNRLGVMPAADADYNSSRFRAVVEHVIPDDAERAWLQRRLGAALIDAPGMDDLIWIWGDGGAGKGSLVRALMRAFGSYARAVTPTQLLKGKPKDAHPGWKAMLHGARLLVADEVTEGGTIDEAVANELLGSLISARHMHGKSFHFTLAAPLLCTSNGEILIDTTNHRRLKPIPTGPGRQDGGDPSVRAAMSTDAETAACLRWLITGARLFVRHGCRPPQAILERAVDAASRAPVALFTATFMPDIRVRIEDVKARWEDYMTRVGHVGKARMAANKISSALTAAGWISSKSNGVRYLTPPIRPTSADRVTH